MKMKKTILLLWVFTLALLLTQACDKTDEPPVIEPDPEIANEIGFTVNGQYSSLNNKNIRFDEFNTNEDVVWYGYDENIDATQLKAVGKWKDNNVFFKCYFSGKTPGSYEFVEADFTEGSETQAFHIVVGETELYVRWLNFTIEEYGDIGERIKGTFNAQMVDVAANPANGGELVYINNGKFDLKRTF